MDSLNLTATVFGFIFAGGVVGLQLQRALPENSMTGAGRDATGAVVGLVTLRLALVLGLLIWTAFGVFSTQKALIQTLAVNGLRFDQALQDYGPKGADGRRILREGLKNAIAEIWRSGDDREFAMNNYSYTIKYVKARTAYLNTLDPASEQEKAAKAEAIQAASAIGQTRIQMALALVDPISYPLVSIVVAWATFLFCGYGLLSRREAMSYVAFAVGAMGVASAIYIISDLASPYSGLFQVSPAPILDLLQAVDEALTPAGGHR